MEKRNSDEIDLYNLLVKTVFFFRANLILFLIFSVAGIVVSVFGARYAGKDISPRYTIKILVHSKTVSVTVGSAILNTLNSHIGAGETEELARVLSLSAEEARYIESMHTEGIRNEKPLSRDSIYNIVIPVRERSVAPKVIDGVINFIGNNSFVRRQTQLRHAAEAAKGITVPENDRGIEVISSYTVNNDRISRSLFFIVITGLAGGIFAAFAFIALRGIWRIAKS